MIRPLILATAFTFAHGLPWTNASAQTTSAELTAARTEFEARLSPARMKLDAAIKTRAAKYAGELKALEERVAGAGQLDAVVALKAEREAYEKGGRTNGFAGDPKVPAAARQVRAAFDGDLARLRAAAAPEGRALAANYVKQLGELERKLTTQKDVAGALAVRQEREETQASGMDPLNPPSTGLIGDWQPAGNDNNSAMRGKTLSFKRDGTWKNAEGQTGTWEWEEKSKRKLRVRWDAKPWRDTYTLSADGKRLDGKDNQGSALSFVRIR